VSQILHESYGGDQFDVSAYLEQHQIVGHMQSIRTNTVGWTHKYFKSTKKSVYYRHSVEHVGNEVLIEFKSESEMIEDLGQHTNSFYLQGEDYVLE
jgi:hypothetical protein